MDCTLLGREVWRIRKLVALFDSATGDAEPSGARRTARLHREEPQKTKVCARKTELQCTKHSRPYPQRIGDRTIRRRSVQSQVRTPFNPSQKPENRSTSAFILKIQNEINIKKKNSIHSAVALGTFSLPHRICLVPQVASKQLHGKSYPPALFEARDLPAQSTAYANMNDTTHLGGRHTVLRINGLRLFTHRLQTGN